MGQPTYVSHTNGPYQDSAETTSVVSSVAVQAGDLIMVAAKHEGLGGVTYSVADNASGGSNVYTQRAAGDSYGSDPNVTVKMFTAVAKASETLTITVTRSTATGFNSAKVCVARPPTGETWIFDNAVGAGSPSGGNNAPTTGSMSVNGGHHFAWTASWDDSASTYTAGSGWTENGLGNNGTAEYRIFHDLASVTGDSSVTGDFSLNQTAQWAACMVAVRCGSYLGSYSKNNAGTANSGSFSVTVPTGTKLVVVAWSGYAVATGEIPPVTGGTITLDGNAVSYPTQSGETQYFFMCALGYQANPTIGAQTFAWDFKGTNPLASDEMCWTFLFYDDTFVSVRDCKSANDSTCASGSPISTGSLAAQSGDLVVAACGVYQSTGTTGGDAAYTWSGNVTQLTDINSTGATGNLATADAVASGSLTITSYTNGGADGSIVAIAFQLSAGGSQALVGAATGGATAAAALTLEKLLAGAATGGASAAADVTAEKYLYPDAILASSHLAGAVTDIDDPHGALDGAWLTVN